MKILPSALRHGISRKVITDFIQRDDYLEFDLLGGFNYEKYMLVGFTPEMVSLIEIGVEFNFEENEMIIFHADKARNPYKSYFEDMKDGKKKRQ